MGLDMYLKAEKYVSGWSHRPDPAYATILAALGIEPCEDSPSLTVSTTVGYWRKANAIHRWFVENVQGAEDECKATDVSREQLAKLRETCKKVLANPEVAHELLPTASGFFFGSTDYDEYYVAKLQSTVAILDRVLDDPAYEDFNFSYRASW